MKVRVGKLKTCLLPKIVEVLFVWSYC